MTFLCSSLWKTQLRVPLRKSKSAERHPRNQCIVHASVHLQRQTGMPGGKTEIRMHDTFWECAKEDRGLNMVCVCQGGTGRMCAEIHPSIGSRPWEEDDLHGGATLSTMYLGDCKEEFGQSVFLELQCRPRFPLILPALPQPFCLLQFTLSVILY